MSRKKKAGEKVITPRERAWWDSLRYKKAIPVPRIRRLKTLKDQLPLFK